MPLCHLFPEVGPAFLQGHHTPAALGERTKHESRAWAAAKVQEAGQHVAPSLHSPHPPALGAACLGLKNSSGFFLLLGEDGVSTDLCEGKYVCPSSLAGVPGSPRACCSPAWPAGEDRDRKWSQGKARGALCPGEEAEGWAERGRDFWTLLWGRWIAAQHQRPARLAWYETEAGSTDRAESDGGPPQPLVLPPCASHTTLKS